MAESNARKPNRPAVRKRTAAEVTARRRKSLPGAVARKSRSGAPGRASRDRSTMAIGPARKPTISTPEAVGRLTSLLAEFPALYAIWATAELAPAFREELMVAVARQNDAPYCNWMHRTWAELEGASSSELAKIEQLDSRGLDRRKWAAVAYVRALASSDFKGTPAAMRRAMEAHYTQREISDIERVARVMDLINRMANTYDAMLSRLQRKPRGDSRVLDEAVFSATFFSVAPLMLLLMSRLSERSYLDTTRSLVDYVRRYHAGD